MLVSMERKWTYIWRPCGHRTSVSHSHDMSWFLSVLIWQPKLLLRGWSTRSPRLCYWNQRFQERLIHQSSSLIVGQLTRRRESQTRSNLLLKSLHLVILSQLIAPSEQRQSIRLWRSWLSFDFPAMLYHPLCSTRTDFDFMLELNFFSLQPIWGTAPLSAIIAHLFGHVQWSICPSWKSAQVANSLVRESLYRNEICINFWVPVAVHRSCLVQSW